MPIFHSKPSDKKVTRWVWIICGAVFVLLFVVDILNEEATMMIPNALSKTVAEASFGATVSGDTVVLPGVMSRKKQIIPNLKTS